MAGPLHMELLLCVNAKTYRWPHNLQKGKVYECIDAYRCSCGKMALFKVAGAELFIGPAPNKVFCSRCARLVPQTVWGYFWHKRFIPINDPKLTLTEEEKETMNV